MFIEKTCLINEGVQNKALQENFIWIEMWHIICIIEGYQVKEVRDYE